MSDAWVRRQGAEIGDISVIGKAIESVVATRWPEKDLHASLRSSHFEIGFRRMLHHVENRRVAFPGLSRPRTTAITLSSQMLQCLFPSLETLQPKILQRHHSSSPGLSSRAKPCAEAHRFAASGLDPRRHPGALAAMSSMPQPATSNPRLPTPATAVQSTPPLPFPRTRSRTVPDVENDHLVVHDLIHDQIFANRKT
jgi:hypothetical protein